MGLIARFFELLKFGPKHLEKELDQRVNTVASEIKYDGVGPIVRAGDLADAVHDAIVEDNPDKEVELTDRGDYIRIHTSRRCLLRQSTLEKYLGHAFDLSMLEKEMPSFSGRFKTVNKEFLWYYEN